MPRGNPIEFATVFIVPPRKKAMGGSGSAEAEADAASMGAGPGSEVAREIDALRHAVG